ncbi:MAG: 2-oxo acid dehydrogenase subunit E2 [Clostridiales Family XIII bacterium]|jgi:pyruvate dehydrogenase E2 component (dihydrolipoamide acetyltransferase)|nr:2-oxo acid dehydrogenase subunit E2 [Clostridiales Family XIII bacterium]
MAQEVLMPKEGITVETCLIGDWHKEIGDAVEEGDILFDYETDKATFECASQVAGVLLHRFGESGDEVPVLTPVAIVGDAGEDISAMIKAAAHVTQADASVTQADAHVTQAAEPQSMDPGSAPGMTNGAPGVTNGAPGMTNGAPGMTKAAAPAEVKASPRAKGIAAAQGIELAAAIPTGPNGRILARDVIAAAAQRFDQGAALSNSTAAAPAGGPPAPAGVLPVYTDEPLTKIRSLIAKSMQTSLQNSAQLTHHHSFDASAALAMRADFKASAEEQGFFGVSVGDIVLYVTSRILSKHPEINAQLLDGVIYRKYNTVNLGVAVDTPRGLMVPTVFGAEKKSILEISAEVKELAAACREGKISPDKLTGATFTVSNLGATGVEMFTPIINPPQVAILGVCAAVDRVRRGKGGRPEIYPAIGLSLTYDHRAVDGAPASRFAAELGAELADFSWKTLYLEGLSRG